MVVKWRGTFVPYLPQANHRGQHICTPQPPLHPIQGGTMCRAQAGPMCDSQVSGFRLPKALRPLGTNKGPSRRSRAPQDKLEPRMTIQSSAKRIKTRSINRATRTNQDLAHLYTILLNININVYHYKNANS